MSKVINKAHYAQCLVGKTIVSVRYLSEAEMENLGWFPTGDPTCVISFNDDTYALVQADPEGNGTGFLDIGRY
jgi:hypothetical protein